jgi:hypothetical protein
MNCRNSGEFRYERVVSTVSGDVRPRLSWKNTGRLARPEQLGVFRDVLPETRRRPADDRLEIVGQETIGSCTASLWNRIGAKFCGSIR